MTRSTRLEVDLDILEGNYRELLRLLRETAPAGSQPPRVACVLKADAYGLGALRAAEALLGAGAERLALALLPEALELRRRFPEAELLVMGHTPTELLPLAVKHRITCSIFDLPQAEALSAAARAAGGVASFQLKVDSGMNRLGLKPGPGAAELALRMAGLPGLEMEGSFTHLALEGEDSDRRQAALYASFLAELEAAGLDPGLRSICDSIGLARYPEFRLDLVRPGALLFGAPPLRAPLLEGYGLRLPLALRTRISRIRRLEAGEGVGYDYSWRAPPGGALVATLPAGYADGYRRAFSNKAEILVRGRRAPVVGLVMMDQLTADLSGIPGAEEGDEALLLGAEAGGRLDSGIPLLEAARWADTNRNELLAGIGRRVPRIYHRSGIPAGEADYLLGERTEA